ncbi:hypothetical protein SPTER_01970 [Sporomusa termitida]|uniref:Uncharacterized protein n=1 Tax=Sporomusa termitida TaxID=2377 RepID=A0A517DNW0_9FIRM|nr:hypothetical protein SPTER_01970 [Sporomusa termitida]
MDIIGLFPAVYYLNVRSYAALFGYDDDYLITGSRSIFVIYGQAECVK